MGYPAIQYISPDDYLAMEKSAFEKHEYFGGEMYAMAGASEIHIRLVTNLGGEIYGFLKGKTCRSYSTDFRVATPLFDTYMYPDLTIVCDETKLKLGSFDTLINPAVIIEVLSPSTEERDRVLKFFFYRQVPSLKEYILVETAKCTITTFLKQPDGSWAEQIVSGINETLVISTIDMHIALSDIYALTAFSKGSAG